MASTEMTPKEKIQVWFDNPDTPADAWKEWTIDQLTTACDVSSSSILRHLPDIVKVRHPEIENYIVFSAVRKEIAQKLHKKGERPADKDIKKIKEFRKTHTIHETAALTGFSAATVQRYSKKKRSSWHEAH